MQGIIKINGFNGGYGVSSDGRVYTFKQGRNCEVRQHEHKGYKRVFLFNENKRKSFFVHRLVALHFIPVVVGKDWVNHKDGDKSNNNFSNLEWCSREENQKHSREVLGNTNRGVRNGNHGYRMSKFYPSETFRSRLIELGVPRNKHDIVSLGEMLPASYYSYKTKDGKFWCCHDDWERECECCGMFYGKQIEWTLSETEADARARMLVWLIENKYANFAEGQK